MQTKSKYSLKALLRKVFAAFILVSISIALALIIARLSFKELMSTVDELSAPNEKLTMLNNVFEEITTLDQIQRAEAIKNPYKPYESFIEQSASVTRLLDSLKKLKWDTAQLNRLGEMKQILAQRNEIFFSYLKVKAEILDNREFSVQLDTLAAILQNDQLAIDTTLITTHKKTTTTYLKDTAASKKVAQRSFLKKIFSKRKNKPALDTPKIKVEQVFSVSVDTLAVARQNQALIELEKLMRQMDYDQRVQRKNLQSQELELIHSNSLFINQLLGVLHTVENEELQQMRDNNRHAVTVMNQSISRTNILMLCFFIAAAILVYLIWVDISRSNYYKELLEKARDNAEQLSQIKQRFLANMSHELRTPLQSIIGFAEQLKNKDTENREEVEAIYSSSEHLLHIVNEVLDYSRISSGHFVMGKENFSLLTLIKEVEASMRVQAERKNLTFILDSKNLDDWVVNSDPFRLRQILYNVIGNAIKFTDRGFVKLAVTTKDEAENILCVFEVTDTGIGIERKDVERIFNQFEQANSSITQKYGGTGLGLSIVKSLVTAQNGTVEITSDPGIGTTFRIELRFEKAKLAAHKTIPTKNLRAYTRKQKVMLIDDDKLILRLCSIILKKHNIPFSLFSQPRQLLNSPIDSDVTHILMDIRMPEINGIDLCLALRKKYPSTVRFIALTAHVLPEEKQSLLEMGFDDVLPKPFREGELLQTLNALNDGDSNPNDQPDLSTLRKMTMNDDALFNSIVNQFIEETMNDLVHLKEELSDENAQLLRETVHKLGGRFAQLGMTEIAKRIQMIEKKLVDGQGVSVLSHEISNIATQINNTVTQIRLTTLENLN